MILRVIKWFLRNFILRHLKNFRDLDNRYTKEEYRQLLDVLPPLCVTRSLIIPIILSDRKYENLQVVIKQIKGNKEYAYVSLYLYSTENLLYDVMYNRSLRDMPLFLNKDQEKSSIAKWRLDIGK